MQIQSFPLSPLNRHNRFAGIQLVSKMTLDNHYEHLNPTERAKLLKQGSQAVKNATHGVPGAVCFKITDVPTNTIFWGYATNNPVDSTYHTIRKTGQDADAVKAVYQLAKWVDRYPESLSALALSGSSTHHHTTSGLQKIGDGSQQMRQAVLSEILKKGFTQTNPQNILVIDTKNA